jgi:hypothetical protein
MLNVIKILFIFVLVNMQVWDCYSKDIQGLWLVPAQTGNATSVFIMGNEIWIDINGYNGDYQISNHGNVKSLKRDKPIILRPQIYGKGYFGVSLSIGTRQKQFYIHRLVAENFIEGRADGLEVNHKDGDKSNNGAENLEWITHRKNMQHGYKNGLMNPYSWLGVKTEDNPRIKAIIQMGINGEFIAEYGSGKQASEESGVSQGSISSCCHRVRESVKGFKFKFKD